jgi:N-acetylmuramoyl-L-alanine amidase
VHAANTFVLVIDPGHGGKDSGAVGRKGKEKNINLAVSTLVGQYIANEHPDVKVVYTRTKDVFLGLNERADIANKANANLFISIHTNAVSRKPNVKGAEVFTFGIARNAENLEVAKRENSVILLEENYEEKYEGFNPGSSESYIIFEFMVNAYADQSINFASMVQKELVKTAKRGDRGVKQAGYLVLRRSSMPRILIELDFISNAEAENYMLSQTGQRNLARSISNAFTQYKKEFDRKENNSTKESLEKRVETLASTKPAQPASSVRTYKIQILASGKKLPDKSPELKGYKADYYVEGNLYKYTHGESSNWNEIENLRKKISKDFKGAFIVSFENGVKIPNK